MENIRGKLYDKKKESYTIGKFMVKREFANRIIINI